MHILYTIRRYLPPSSFTRACDRVRPSAARFHHLLFLPADAFFRDLQVIFQVAHLQIAEITENLIGPVVGVCGVLVFLPPLGALLVHPLFGREEQRAGDSESTSAHPPPGG